MEVWEQCLGESLDPDVRGRIIGCQTQMKTFKLFFGINLGFVIYSITDNLSKTLQAEKISAIESWEVAELTISTLERMRSEDGADNFFEKTKKKASKISFIKDPVLPRKKRAHNYNTMERYFNVIGLETTGKEFHPSTQKEHFRIIYLEVLMPLSAPLRKDFISRALRHMHPWNRFYLKL